MGTLDNPYLINFNTAQESSSLYPNPFKDKLTIKVPIPAKDGVNNHTVQFSVFDITGRLIFTHSPELVTGTYYQTFWNGKNAVGVSVASGIYIP